MCHATPSDPNRRPRRAGFPAYVVLAILAPAQGLWAQSEPEPLAEPTGEVILMVSGDLAVTNADGVARFDLAMLKALGPETITTSTLWTEGVQDFTGIPLYRLLERLGAKGSVIDATALNDYWVDIPVTDAVKGGPILAYAQNGVPLSVRDMGPLWVIYPYDSDVDYQSEVIYSRSIWQLQRMAIRP